MAMTMSPSSPASYTAALGSYLHKDTGDPEFLFVAHASYADLISFRSKRCIKDSNNALHTSDPSYDR
jgi:hypothetical protein